MLRKLSFTIITFLFLIFQTLSPALAQQEQEKNLNIYFFYGRGCPHCAKEREFLSKLKGDYQDRLQIHEFEVYYNQENVKLLDDIATKLNIEVGGVPFLLIGNETFIGYGSDETTGKEIFENIRKCLNTSCPDDFAEKLLAKEDKTETVEETDLVSIEDDNVMKLREQPRKPEQILLNTYFFGDINIRDLSLPLATILIALVDGFNPCAMWVLIFLISMLINMKDKRKLYVLGTVFILTSGLVYFFFLAAWFNFFKFIGYVYWIKMIIGVVAIISGILHIKEAVFSKGGCHATNETQRKNIIQRIKDTVSQRSYLLSIFGIVALAISVNFIEVVCSAGLPAIYASLLSSIQLSVFEYYFYLVLYILFFMIDDLFIFMIAIKTFELTGIAKKYTKWSNLIGGILILIIGMILIIKPELLMFG